MFKQFDFLIFPGTKGSAPKIDSLFENGQLNSVSDSHWSDNLLLISNFVGNPSINIPIGKENGMTISLNIDSYWKNDELVIELAEFIIKKIKT